MTNGSTSKLNPGEKYLSISLLGQIKLAAFPNKNKKDNKSPDFIGQGISVWVNEKKQTKTESQAAL